jgi:hypothetical protein
MRGTQHTFAVIAEAHLGLSKTNCILSLTNAIVLLKLCLVETLAGKVDLDGLDTNVLGAG